MSKTNSELNSEILNLCVCVPSAGTWDVDFGRSLVTATANFMLWTPPKEMGYRGRIFQILTADSSMLVRNRHDLVKAAMKAGASHILFLDSDMTFPKDLFERMIEIDAPILAANCTHRRMPVKFTAHDFDGLIIDSREKKGLQSVRQVGCAVMMIKREFFEKAQPPYFLMDWTPDYQSYSGEDVYFCQVAQEAGFNVVIDHELSMEIEHVGRYRYGPKDVGLENFSQEELESKQRFMEGV